MIFSVFQRFLALSQRFLALNAEAFLAFPALFGLDDWSDETVCLLSGNDDSVGHNFFKAMTCMLVTS